MNTLRKLMFLIFLLLFIGQIHAQKDPLDSLLYKLEMEKDENNKVQILYDLVEILRATDSIRAMTFSNMAIQIATKNGNKEGLAKGYRAKGNVLYSSGKYTEAKKFYLSALPIFRELKIRKSEGSILNDLCLMHNFLGDLDKALEYGGQSLKIDLELKDSASMAASYNNLALIFLNQNKIEQAVENLRRVMSIDSLLGDWAYYGQGLNNVAVIYHRKNEYDKALSYALKAYMFCDSIGIPETAQQSAGMVGDIYRMLGNYENSLLYLKKSLKNAKESGMPARIGMAFGRLQLTYYKMDSIEQSLAYFDSAKVFAPPIQIPGLHNNLGQLYENKMNDFSSAKKQYRESIKLAKAVSRPSLEINPLFNMGFILVKEGEYKKAQQFVDEGLAISKELSTVIEPNVLARIAEVYNFSGSTSLAYEILENAYLVKDSLLNVKERSQSQILSYEKRIRDYEILEKEQLLVEERRKFRDQLYFLLLLGGLTLLAIGISYFIYTNNKKLKSLNKKLEYLKNEVHHRVKNDFQSIASMIFIQLSQIENAEIKNTLSGVRERILMMGHIHSLFYKEADYMKMGLRNYLHKLVEDRTRVLSNEYVKADLSIEIDVDGQIEDRITFDEAKQMGVVINEIITNAFKHAFIDNQSPKLSFTAKLDDLKQLIIKIVDNGRVNSGRSFDRTNFGMNMMNMICDQLDWNLNYLSEERGTTFTLVIPSK